MITSLAASGARLATARGQAAGRLARQGKGSTVAPKETMPGSRMTMMLGVAVIFDVIKVLFSLSFIFFPLVLGVAAAAAADSATTEACSSVLGTNEFCGFVGTLVGGAAGAAAAAGGIAANVFSGGAVSAIGIVFASIVGLFSFLVFFLWFTLSGITFFGSPRALKRYGARMAQGVLGSIPFIALLPWTTFGVWFICREARAEDKENKARAQREAQEQAIRTRAQQEASVHAAAL